jgi:hypothetical protein
VRNKESTVPPFRTWEFFECSISVLGATWMQKVWSRGYGQLRRWSRDPAFTSDSERNPLDRLKIVLRELREQGHGDVAESSVRMLAHAIGMEVVSTDPPTPEHDTLAEELLDIHPAVVEHALACQDGDVGAAEHYEREAMREIQEPTEACRRAVKTIKPQAA